MVIAMLSDKVHASKPCTTGARGRKFALGILKPAAYSGAVDYILTVMSDHSATVYISSPGMNYNYRLYVRQGSSRTESLPTSLLTTVPDTVNRTAILITSNVEVTVSVTVKSGTHYQEGLLLLPTPVLSTEYVIPGYASQYSNIMIVGLTNGTRFDVLDAKTFITRVDRKVLNEHDTYLLTYANSYDLSGHIIRANHPVAIFSATFASTGACMIEQAIPTSSWAYRYIVPDFYASHNNHYLRAFASEDDTYINTYYSSHPGTMHLNKGQFISSYFKNGDYVLTSSKPIMVMQYMSTGTFMTTVPAISQFGNSFAIPPPVSNWGNYFVLIAAEHDEAGITFEGQNIPSRMQTSSVVVDNVRYVIATYSLLPGTERVFHSSSSGRFGGFVYGRYSDNTYYAYPLGLTLTETGCIPPTTLTTPVSMTTAVPTSKLNETVCFSCTDMSALLFCDHVEVCASHEKCYVEKYLTAGGETKFSSGCSFTNMCPQHIKRASACRECCTGSYCNSAGCGDTSVPVRSQRGPVCYDCEHVGRIEDCHRVTLCRSDQVCSIRKYSWGDALSHFTLGCEDKHCLGSGQVAVGRKRSAPVCEQCCKDDFCNRACTGTGGQTGVIIG